VLGRAGDERGEILRRDPGHAPDSIPARPRA
jgi:hypothetical protein